MKFTKSVREKNNLFLLGPSVWVAHIWALKCSNMFSFAIAERSLQGQGWCFISMTPYLQAYECKNYDLNPLFWLIYIYLKILTFQ